MEFSSAGSHMIMQGFEANGDLYAFQPAANPNPNPDHWQQVNGFAMPNRGLSLSLSNPMPRSHQEQLFMDEGSGRLLFQSSQPQQHQQPFMLRRSKYLIPAQELLNEFCNLGAIGGNNTGSSKKKEDKANPQWDEGGPSSLYSMDLVELQKRKARLLSLLEEVISLSYPHFFFPPLCIPFFLTLLLI